MMSEIIIIFCLIAIVCGIAQLLNEIDSFLATIPVEEVDNGPHLYIRKDLKNGRIY